MILLIYSQQENGNFQFLVEEELAEEKENQEIILSEGFVRFFQKEPYLEVINMGNEAEMPLYYILYEKKQKTEGNQKIIMCDVLTVNDSKYTVLRLLGKGKGGYSYLVTDGKEQYVLKQIHHEPCEYYTFGDKLQSELRDYETLRKLGIPMPQLLAVNHPQERILKEYIAGATVSELLKEGRMDSIWLEQVRAMCRLLYPAGLNIDYYPTNFVPCKGKLYYIDYECNSYMEKWDFEHWGIQYWTEQK